MSDLAGARRGIRTPDRLIKSQLLLPTELCGQESEDIKEGGQGYFNSSGWDLGMISNARIVGDELDAVTFGIREKE